MFNPIEIPLSLFCSHLLILCPVCVLLLCFLHNIYHIFFRYRTFYKPKYKVGFKTMTELEWRCCPGYSGENCYDGPTSLPDVMMPPFKGAALPHRPGLKAFPHGPRPPVDQKPGGGQLEPGRPFPGVPEHRPIPTGQLPVGGGKTSYGENKSSQLIYNHIRNTRG